MLISESLMPYVVAFGMTRYKVIQPIGDVVIGKILLVQLFFMVYSRSLADDFMTEIADVVIPTDYQLSYSLPFFALVYALVLLRSRIHVRIQGSVLLCLCY